MDRLLPRGGLVRGQMTEMVGERGSGRTTLLVGAMMRLARQGERSAVVDLDGDLDPASFAEAGLSPGWVWVIRAGELKEGLWATDVLVRSGHFGLVVLDGVSGDIPASWLRRLQVEARQGGVALVVGSRVQPVSAPGSLKIRFRPLGLEWEVGLGGPVRPRRVRFGVQLYGQGREVSCEVACRTQGLLGRHLEVGDRKEARWTEGGVWLGDPV
ncbi:MAG: hypothetical protein JW797_11095 [Bradymonadales bacterium]|nr:hypothetical protein [Bradymonadales bacterium]